jgi:flagellin
MVALNSINTNIAAYSAQANISNANSMTSSSIARLSSGNRIVRAADDVAALSVGTSLRTNVTTLKIASLNTNQGSSLLQVADGALSQITDILQRQAAIATQASSGSLSSAERGFLNQEFQALREEIDRLVDGTNFNGVTLLDGSLGSTARLISTSAIADNIINTNANANINNGNTGGLAANGQSTRAIEAFFIRGADEGESVNQANAANTNIELVDASGTALANQAFEDVNPALYGAMSAFRITGFEVGISVDAEFDINGLTFRGSIGVAAANTAFTFTNGDDRIEVSSNVAVVAGDLANFSAAQSRITALNTEFNNVGFARVASIDGVDFTGTIFDGATGLAGGGGVAQLRTFDPENTSVRNFQFVAAATGNNVLTVEVGGQTLTARIGDAVAVNSSFNFVGADGTVLQINLTGSAASGAGNIFTDATYRERFVEGLNLAFASATAGVDFAVGTSSSDVLNVNIGNATTTRLYSNENLNVVDQDSALDAIDAINAALDRVTSLRADVGALQSRFDFASANIESSIQNQDAARGVLLDTDIAAESTAYATSQVQLQAGIAVLAQANLLPQNLLKLIG